MEDLFLLMDEDVAAGSSLMQRFNSLLPNALLTPFLSAFITSYLLIIVSELGDKTFFIAAILSMKRGARVTFLGAGFALVIMTLISALAGRALPALVHPRYTRIASVALFLCFGIRLVYEGYYMDALDADDEPSEFKEVELELATRRGDLGADALERGASPPARALEPSPPPLARSARALLKKALLSAAFTEAFTMTFAAEWGDRSQIATLALGASKNIWGVNLGAMTAHLTCTALAVLGGRVLVRRLSEKTISLVGGATFLVFAFAGIFLEY